jgi:hypothetical protein
MNEDVEYIFWSGDSCEDEKDNSFSYNSPSEEEEELNDDEEENEINLKKNKKEGVNIIDNRKSCFLNTCYIRSNWKKRKRRKKSTDKRNRKNKQNNDKTLRQTKNKSRIIGTMFYSIFFIYSRR